MLAAGVGFYSEAAQLPPIFQLKQSALNDFDFDSDDAIEDDFDFDDMDAEYFDSTNQGDEDGGEPGTAARPPSTADDSDRTKSGRRASRAQLAVGRQVRPGDAPGQPSGRFWKYTVDTDDALTSASHCWVYLRSQARAGSAAWQPRPSPHRVLGGPRRSRRLSVILGRQWTVVIDVNHVQVLQLEIGVACSIRCTHSGLSI